MGFFFKNTEQLKLYAFEWDNNTYFSYKINLKRKNREKKTENGKNDGVKYESFESNESKRPKCTMQ